MATVVESPPVNRADDALTPTASHFNIPPRQSDTFPASGPSPSKTPTRSSFSAHPSEKRPLSAQSASADKSDHTDSPATRHPTSRGHAKHDSDDIKMDNNEEEQQDGSDNDNDDDDENGPAKKKRSQRFFCTQFPPCNLSFTRSEHLARHIRKHTGERPFQCHCMRRFSRLDNLRQHAQTVHVNEDIPGDSLAATGTRYQRQVRTERIRPAGHRQRASTLSAPGGHSRGHSRNMSNSSVGSVSDFGSPEDPRRRPASLVLPPTTPPRHNLSIETYPSQPQLPYYNYPQSGYSTPAYSAADPGSPRLSAGLGSPIAIMPRSTIGWGGQNSSRRLSIPSGPSPYHAPPPAFAVPPSAPFVHHQSHSSMGSFAPPLGPSQGSPTHSHFGHSRHQSLESAEDWRRRTWHASTLSNVETRPATSSLTYHQRPDDPQPVSTTQPAAQQAVRLPGIDSFDRPQMQPGARNRRLTNDMEVDEVSQAGDDVASKRDSWGSMHQNLNSLELSQNTPPRDNSHWRHSTGSHTALAAAARPLTAPHSGVPMGRPEIIRDTAERPSTPKRQKRSSDWSYEAALADGDGGPGPAVRTSPDGSSNSDELPTPMNHPAGDYRPAIVHDNGYVEGQPGGILDDTSKAQEVNRAEPAAYAPAPPTLHASPKHGEDTGRLDALVAVATSEDRAMSRQ